MCQAVCLRARGCSCVGARGCSCARLGDPYGGSFRSPYVVLTLRIFWIFYLHPLGPPRNPPGAVLAPGGTLMPPLGFPARIREAVGLGDLVAHVQLDTLADLGLWDMHDSRH